MRTRLAAWALGLLCVLSVATAFPGQPPPPPPPAAPPSPYLSPQEIDAKFRELSPKGWTKRDMDMALNASRRDRELFGLYVGYRDQKIDPGLIARSFDACKGDPATIKEYWGYVQNNKFHPQEVEQVFRSFPPNNITRWNYFYYRSSGFGAVPGPSYTPYQCMKIFQDTRFDVNYVKEYFASRNQGKSPKDAWAPIKDKVKGDIDKEKEADLQQQEEGKKTKEQDAESRKKVVEMTKKPAKSLEKSKEQTEGKKTHRLTAEEAQKLFNAPPEENAPPEKSDTVKDKQATGDETGQQDSGPKSEPPAEEKK